MRINIREILRLPEVQLREGLDMERVIAMTEFEEQGGHLPAVTVVGDRNILADGHHRVFAAERAGRTEIDANHEEGGIADAIAISLNHNDSAGFKPLTKEQRNNGIYRLLAAGWSQRQIGRATGIPQGTVRDIAHRAALRETLSTETAEALTDTAIGRISRVAPENRATLADAAAEAGLNDGRLREAINNINAGTPVADAVAAVTPTTIVVPTPIGDVAKQARAKLKEFLAQTMTVDGVEYDFWQVLDVFIVHLRGNAMAGDLQANGLADLLAEVSVTSDKYASLLRSATPEEEPTTALVEARN